MPRPFTAYLSLTLLAGIAGIAQESEAPIPLKKDESYCVLFEPRLLHSGVFVPIPGAKETGYAAARLANGQIKPYTRTEFRKLRLPWKDFFEKGVAVATQQLATLAPKYYKDKNGVITHGLIETPNQPLTASAILSPKFFERFESVMGTRFYVAIPDRTTIYLFPIDNGMIAELQNDVVLTYELAIYPASLELFELSGDGIRIMGKFGKT